MAEASSYIEGEGATSREARLAFAARTIAENRNLRFFVREYLTFCGVLHPTSVHDANPHLSSFNQGIQAAGIEFARMLTDVVPLIWPTLLTEEVVENVDADVDADE